jgi:hypothetical protein
VRLVDVVLGLELVVLEDRRHHRRRWETTMAVR